MFPIDKIIEIFSMCDDFSKNFDDIIQKNSIDSCESLHQKNHPFDVRLANSLKMRTSRTSLALLRLLLVTLLPKPR